MKERDSVQSVLLLRKLTRAVTDVVRTQMAEYLATLTPLLQPKALLGEYVQGGQKESSRRADKAFKDLQALYETVASAKPFHLPQELTPPLNFGAISLEITPLDYAHVAQSGADSQDDHGAVALDVGPDVHGVRALAPPGTAEHEDALQRGAAAVRAQLSGHARRDHQPARADADARGAAVPDYDRAGPRSSASCRSRASGPRCPRSGPPTRSSSRAPS